MRLGDHGLTDSMEYKVHYSHLLLIDVASDIQAERREGFFCFFLDMLSYVTP